MSDDLVQCLQAQADSIKRLIHQADLLKEMVDVACEVVEDRMGRVKAMQEEIDHLREEVRRRNVLINVLREKLGEVPAGKEGAE